MLEQFWGHPQSITRQTKKDVAFSCGSAICPVMKNTDLAAPADASPDCLKIWRVIIKFLEKKKHTYTGGCRAFYSGAEAGKYHGYDLSNAALVVHYDGGDLRYCFETVWNSPHLVKQLQELIDKAGFWIEPQTNWASAIYKK